MPFSVKLRRNPGYTGGGARPRYFFEVDLEAALHKKVVSLIPVYCRPNEASHPMLKEVYWAGVAGTRLEKGNLPALESAIPQALANLLDFGTIPYYYVTLPEGDSFPVYLSGGKLRLRLRGEPTLEGRDIGELWYALGDLLERRRKGFAREEIEVSLLLWRELSLCPTAFVFMNGKTFIPIFFHGPQELNYDLIGQPSRFLPVAEAFELREEMVRSLAAQRRLASASELRIVQVRDEVWEGLRGRVQPTGSVLAYEDRGMRTELPVYAVKGEFMAPLRASRLSLLFAPTIEELARKVAAELGSRGSLRSPSYLALETAKGR